MPRLRFVVVLEVTHLARHDGVAIGDRPQAGPDQPCGVDPYLSQPSEPGDPRHKVGEPSSHNDRVPSHPRSQADSKCFNSQGKMYFDAFFLHLNTMASPTALLLAVTLHLVVERACCVSEIKAATYSMNPPSAL